VTTKEKISMLLQDINSHLPTRGPSLTELSQLQKYKEALTEMEK
jgi:uncharacterized protein (UPF0216 family)